LNDPGRPDPDALLQRVQEEEAESRRGRLKIFFGSSAGVGKTYAMLAAAQAARAAGQALLIGIVETHGRSETAAMVEGLPRLPMARVAYRDRTLEEFDLDAALAWGRSHPDGLLLLDELAHSNVPGSRHPKRWQDVDELLGSGIDVWTTLNVQHLESLNDIVGGITGVRVQETVPDPVFDDADEVVVVDLPPDELITRLQQGKVYLPRPGDNRAERAAKNFFRKGNLLALRELALRRTADRVDDEMKSYRRQLLDGRAAGPVWPTREALLACIGPGESGEKVVRASARLAAQLDVPWHALHIESPATPPAAGQRALRLAEELGATTVTLAATAVADTVVKYARQHNLSRVVMGRQARRVRWPWQPSLAQALTERGSDLDVLQVAVPATAPAPSPVPESAGAAAPIRWRDYGIAVAICAAVALLATPLMTVFELTNIVMLFLLAVVVVALRYGRGPAVLASFVSVALFDFFFVAPRFSFAVSDIQYLLTFGVMLLVALVVGQLTAGLKYQAEASTQREGRVRALYEMARDLSAALMPEQVAEIGDHFFAAQYRAPSALLIAGVDDRLGPPLSARGRPVPPVDSGVAQWCFDHGGAAGRGTDTLPASPLLYLPLRAPMRLRGVLALQVEAAVSADERRLLDTAASLLAISLERLHYLEVAQSTTLQMESERLRNSLLSAISHDLRTPLASLVGLAESFALTPPALAPAHARIATAMRDAAMRMNALVNNLLDMARLQAGAVTLNRQWQPLDEVVGSALRAAEPLLVGRRVTVALDDTLPLVELDAVLIERVLVNLLENAAKYTPAGSAIEIGATVHADQVFVTVDDQGPGLPAGREKALFEKFERGHKESATPGVGLGLAIGLSIMQAHGGDLRGETRPGGGARFTLVLPRGTPPSSDGTEDN
jgi:two-component system sensor histidine kinase KdpD